MTVLHEKMHLTSCDYPPDTLAIPACMSPVGSLLLLHHDMPRGLH